MIKKAILLASLSLLLCVAASASVETGGGGTGGGGGSPTGSAAGDLGGTYPNPTVVSVAHVTNGNLPFFNSNQFIQAAAASTAMSNFGGF